MVRPLPPAPCLPVARLASAGLGWPRLACLRPSLMARAGPAPEGVPPRPRSPARGSPITHPSAVPPLRGRPVALEFFFLASVDSSSPSAWFCFNLSVAELQSTQRAYFYQRFPLLHLEPGDCPPPGADPCVRCDTLLLSVPAPWLFLPDRPCPRFAPHLWAGCLPRSWKGGKTSIKIHILLKNCPLSKGGAVLLLGWLWASQHEVQGLCVLLCMCVRACARKESLCFSSALLARACSFWAWPPGCRTCFPEMASFRGGPFTLPLSTLSGLHKPPTLRKPLAASEVGPGYARSRMPHTLMDWFAGLSSPLLMSSEKS